MHLLYESKYQVLLYSEKDKLFISEWKSETKSLDEELYLVEIHKLFSYFRRLKPLLYYCDISHLEYVLSNEVQEFVANLFKDVNATFCAIVTNKKDIYPSIEGVINELKVKTEEFNSRYFFDKEMAMNWLLDCGSKPIHLRNSPAAVNHM